MHVANFKPVKGLRAFPSLIKLNTLLFPSPPRDNKKSNNDRPRPSRLHAANKTRLENPFIIHIHFSILLVASSETQGFPNQDRVRQFSDPFQLSLVLSICPRITAHIDVRTCEGITGVDQNKLVLSRR